MQLESVYNSRILTTLIQLLDFKIFIPYINEEGTICGTVIEYILNTVQTATQSDKIYRCSTK